MKNNSFKFPRAAFRASLTTGLAAVGMVLWGNVAQAQPTITGVVLPNAPNNQNGFGVGSVQFQGAIPPNANQLSFEVTSGTGITGLTVQLTATTLPGVVTTTLLTPTFGLSVTGANTDEIVTTALAPDTIYKVVIAATDAGGTASSTASFDTINPNYFTFEAEDFDYNGGQFFDSLPPGTFPELDGYSTLAATVGIDCNAHTGGGNSYRPNPLETEGEGDVPRIQYASTGYPDFDIGFNNGGDWGNYTRTYPAGLYNIYIRGAVGNSSQANACGLALLTAGYGTMTQTTNHLGNFSITSTGYQNYEWAPAKDTNGNIIAWGAGGDVETLRFNIVGGNCNENAYMLVPAAPFITPYATTANGATNIIYAGNPATLTFFPHALTNTVAMQWQADNGTGGATWSNVTGATSTNYALPTSLTPGLYQYRVIATVTSNTVLETLSSAVAENLTSAALVVDVLPATAPIVAVDTTPSTATNAIGTVTTLNASFTGNIPIGYQWLVSSNLGATFTAVAGATNTTLTVLNLALFTNEYELVATNAIGTNHSTPAFVATTPAPIPPPLQLAGDLIVELRSVDLRTSGETLWTNRSASPNSVGNFHSSGAGGTVLRVSNNVVNAGTPLYGAYSINGLYVNSTTRAVQSTKVAPAEISQNGASSGEAWVYAVTQSGNNCVIGYGLQGGSGEPEQDREMNYGAAGSDCFSGDFGSFDSSWPTADRPTGQWVYLAWTWDGTNENGYFNGAQVVHRALGSSTTFNGYPIQTVDTVIGIGAALTSGPNLAADNFGGGWIASVRLSSGVLNTSQVSNNFLAGPFAVVPITVYPVTATPTNQVDLGSAITLNAVASNELVTFTYQWLADNGSGGTTWTAINNATNVTYTVDTTGFAPGPYEYEVVFSNSSNSIQATSTPITVTVFALTPPTIVQDIMPSSINAYVTQTNTLTALFGGAIPTTLLWQVSSDGVHWTSTGVTTTNITITSEVALTNYYRLDASNPYGTNVSSAALVGIASAPALPAYLPLQTAGDMIVNLQQRDLSASSPVWTNLTSSSNGVGNFSDLLNGGSNLNLSTGAPYLFTRVPVLLVNQLTNYALQSALQAPAEILGNLPVSAEAWIYALAVNEQNSCAISYGYQGGSTDAEADREFNYCNQASGAVSGDFGSYDTAWVTPTAPGAWHYLAWTWDGTTISCYLDGAVNTTHVPSSPLVTPATPVLVGAGIAGTGPAITDPFQGYIGAARLESGVLSAAQIANNFTAGLLGTVAAVVYPPSVSPAPFTSNIVYQGDTVTLGLVDRETTTFTYQWMTDNGSGGTTWANASGAATGPNYVLNLSSLTPGTYEYEVVLTNTTFALSYTSAVVTLTVQAASAPTVVQQPSPATTNAYIGQTVTFTASYTGDFPLTNQWQYSANGTTYANIAGANATTLTLNNLQLTNSGSYRLTAANGLGAGPATTAATLTVSPVPSVGLSFSAGAMTLTWPTGGTLQEASSVLGPWTAVTTTSPYMVTPATAGPALFFRVNFGQ